MKGTMKKLLVSLLAFCLIMGNGAVMASSVAVNTTDNPDGSVNVDVDVTGTIENDFGGPGVVVASIDSEGDVGVIVSGQNVYPENLTPPIDPSTLDLPPVDSVAVETEDIDVSDESRNIPNPDPDHPQQIFGIYTNAMGNEVDVSTGDVNVSTETDATGVFANSNVATIDDGTGRKPDLDNPGDLIVTTGDITVETSGAASKQDPNGPPNPTGAVGVYASASGSTADITTGNITVSGQDEAVGVSANANFVMGMNQGPSSGPSSETSSGPSSGPSSETSSGPSSGPSSDPSSGSSSGPSSETSSGPSSGPSSSSSSVKTNVGVLNIETGDITVTGTNSVGIYAKNAPLGPSEGSEINIVVNGTVSAEEIAIKIQGEQAGTGTDRQGNPVQFQQTFDTDNINLTVWAAKENADHEIVRVVKTDQSGTETTDTAASAAVEARINYIVKIADGAMPKINVTTVMGNTVTIDGNVFDTANENEELTLKITLAADEVLEGVYYNDNDQNSITNVDKLIKNSDGGYVLNMMRGGGMMIGLKIHTHNRADKQENTDNGYDIVTYCTICGAELGRTHYNPTPSAQPPAVPDAPTTTEEELAPAAPETPAAPSAPETPAAPAAPAVPDASIAPGPEASQVISALNAGAEQNAAVPSQTVSTRFVAVDENTVAHGVKAADRLPIEEAFAILGEHLNDEQAVVTIENLDQLLDAAEMTQFKSLAASDCLMVLLSVLSNSDFLQAQLDNMEPAAKALAEEITARISNMSDTEKAEFNKQIQTIFNLKKVIVDNQEYDGISIELTITKGAEETKERYSFFNNGNIWVLYQIEQLQTIIE